MFSFLIGRKTLDLSDKHDPLQQLMSFLYCLPRFRRTVSYLRETLASDSQQTNLGFGGLGGRVGTTLSMSIKRTRILEDSLRILGEVKTNGSFVCLLLFLIPPY